MAAFAAPAQPRVAVRKRTRGKLPKKDALLEIMTLIDERAPTDEQGNPTRWLTPQAYDTLLNDIYVLAADALGVPLK
jgi:hypothetical protein